MFAVQGYVILSFGQYTCIPETSKPDLSFVIYGLYGVWDIQHSQQSLWLCQI